MEKLQKILFPIDFSDSYSAIMPWVFTMAEKFDSEIHLLFVARSLAYYTNVYVPYAAIEDLEQQVIKGSETTMEQFVTKHFSEYGNCKAKVVVGDPSEEILNYAKNEDIGMIIIGTHGKKGLEKILFGSVARRVIKMSPVPVLSINPHKETKQ